MGRFIVHYKSNVNKHLVMHHTVYHKTMVAEALAIVRRAAEAINTEVEVAFDEANVEIEHECLAKLEVFERVEMEDMFDGLVTVIAGDSFCVKEEIERLFSTPVFDYQQKLWFVKPEEFTAEALAVLTGTGASVTVVAPDEDPDEDA